MPLAVRLRLGGPRRPARPGKAALAPDVVAAQHGWWQACHERELPGYPLLGGAAVSLDSAVGSEHADPVSGATPLRSYLGEVRRSG